MIVPDGAVDAQSLMAAALHLPAVTWGVYTEFSGRLGGVDEQLIRDGRLRVLTDPSAIDLRKRNESRPKPIRREPRHLLEILLPQTG